MTEVQLPFCTCEEASRGRMDLPTCEEAFEILKAYWDDPLGMLRRVLLCLQKLGDLPAA